MLSFAGFMYAVALGCCSPQLVLLLMPLLMLVWICSVDNCCCDCCSVVTASKRKVQNLTKPAQGSQASLCTSFACHICITGADCTSPSHTLRSASKEQTGHSLLHTVSCAVGAGDHGHQRGPGQCLHLQVHRTSPSARLLICSNLY